MSAKCNLLVTDAIILTRYQNLYLTISKVSYFKLTTHTKNPQGSYFFYQNKLNIKNHKKIKIASYKTIRKLDWRYRT